MLSPSTPESNKLNNSLFCQVEPNIFKLSEYVFTDNLIKSFSDKKNNFNILSINIQAISAKFDTLKSLLLQLANANIFFDAFCIQETWFDQNNSTDLFKLENYTLINQFKRISTHGGLITYLLDSHRFSILPSFHSTSCENQSIQVHFRGSKDIILNNIYRPQRSQIKLREILNIHSTTNSYL